MKLKNGFKKGTILPIRTTGEKRAVLCSGENGNSLDITELLSKSDLTNLLHVGRGYGVVTGPEDINICYYCQYHVHSQYSILDGMSPLKEIAKKSSGITAITDHGNMYGLLKWQSEMRKQGKKAIFGTEAYVETINGEKAGNHLILLAKNEIGKKNLFILSSNSFYNFYKKPHVSIKDLQEYHEGIICTSACLGGEVAELLSAGDYDGARKVAAFYKALFGEDYYLEIQRHGIPVESQVNPLIVKLGKELGIKIVAANDSHYIDRADEKGHEVLLCIGNGKKLSEPHFNFSGTGYWYKTDSEMVNEFWDMPETIANTLEIAEKCNLAIETGVYHLPKYPLPEGYDNEDIYLCELIDQGFHDRYSGTPHENDSQYRSRLEYEKSIILQMGFSAYFLIVWDYVTWAKNHGILVGPGRGSAAGSLVSYCLKITDLDPIKYNLLFERFLNPDRVSMPDIDMDFEDGRRAEVIEYVKRKYGEDHVCNIITFGSMQSKLAIQDVARTLNCYDLGIAIKKMIPDNAKNLTEALETSGELKKAYDSNADVKNILDIAVSLEGNPRQTGTHACGIVVADAPLKNYIPTTLTYVSADKKEKALSSQVTMTEVEELGLLKADFLGLKTMSVIGNSLKAINLSRQKDGIHTLNNYREIPINDPYVYEDFSKGKSFAVFQIESDGMRSFMSNLFSDVTPKIKEIESRYGFSGFGDFMTGQGTDSDGYISEMSSFGDELFERLVAGVSLYRPGPLDYIPEYLKNMQNHEHIQYDTPLIEPILKPTYGVIVYQEQVMQIIRTLAGFTMGQADIVRKAMGKKKQDIMDEYKPYFISGSGTAVDGHTGNLLNIKGCIANDIPRHVAEIIWDKMSDFAKYAFNKSHAAVYAVLTATCGWLKLYYPAYYMAEMMNAYIDSSTKLKSYISITKRMGITILGPDINESEGVFTSDGTKIRFGLKGINGLSKSVPKIIEERHSGIYKSFPDFIERTFNQGINSKAISSLVLTGAFDQFPCSRKAKRDAIEEIIRSVKKENKQIEGQMSFFDTIFADNDKFIINDKPEFDQQEKLLLEKENSGMYISEHPLDDYDGILKEQNVSEIGLVLDENGEVQEGNITVAGIINEITIRYTKKDGRPMAVFSLEDRSSDIKCVIFPDDYETMSGVLNKNAVVLVSGTVTNDDNFGLQLLTHSITEIKSVKQGINVIYIKLDNLSQIKEMNQMLCEYPGNIPVFSQIGKQLFKMNTVTPSSTLFMELQDHLGSENLKVQ